MIASLDRNGKSQPFFSVEQVGLKAALVKAIFYKKRLQPNTMATVTDINIHAIPVYDGQNPAARDPAQNGSARSEGFGKVLSESTAEHNNYHKKQVVKDLDPNNAATGAGSNVGPETRAEATPKPGDAQQPPLNKGSETAAAATEPMKTKQGAEGQGLPLEGKGLPDSNALMGQKGTAAVSHQGLQPLTAVKDPALAIPAKTTQGPSSPVMVAQTLGGLSQIVADPDAGVAEILGLQPGLKGRLGDATGADLLRSLVAGSTPADLKGSGNAQQNLTAQGPAAGIDALGLRSDPSALNATITMPALADQAAKAPLSAAAITAAAVVSQDRLADLDRRVRSQGAALGERGASNRLTGDGKQTNADLGWLRQDGIADLFAKSANTHSQMVQIPTPALTGPGQQPGPGALAAVLPSLIDSNALGGAFKLPSGFGVSGGAAQGQLVTPFSQPAWAQELAQQAKFMVRDQLRFVELKLNPANLGSVEIVLKQEEEQTTLMFFAKNPAVREALEASLQKLQKSFDDDGLQLEETFVSDQSLSEHRQQAASDAEQDEAAGLNRSAGGADQTAITDEQARRLIPANDQLLDLWA